MKLNWITTLLVLATIQCPASAYAQVSTRYPFCLQGDDYPGWSNCTFTSYQQCQASASGTFDECLANPWYQAGDNAAPAPDQNTAGPGILPCPSAPHPTEAASFSGVGMLDPESAWTRPAACHSERLRCRHVALKDNMRGYRAVMF